MRFAMDVVSGLVTFTVMLCATRTPVKSRGCVSLLAPFTTEGDR
jgi:hypothetical protein